MTIKTQRNTWLSDLRRYLDELAFDLANMTRFAVAGLVIIALAALIGPLFTAFPLVLAEFIARLISGSGQPFEQAYGAFTIAVLILTMSPISIALTIIQAQNDIPVSLEDALKENEE